MEKATWFNLPAIVTNLIERIEALEAENQSLLDEIEGLEERIEALEPAE